MKRILLLLTMVAFTLSLTACSMGAPDWAKPSLRVSGHALVDELTEIKAAPATEAEQELVLSGLQYVQSETPSDVEKSLEEIQIYVLGVLSSSDGHEDETTAVRNYLDAYLKASQQYKSTEDGWKIDDFIVWDFLEARIQGLK